MKSKCRRCKKEGDHIVKGIWEHDDPPHAHLKCIYCEYEFNKWLCDRDVIKKTFGSSWEDYY